MKLKTFLNMSSDREDYISICKNGEKLYTGTIEDYLSNKKSINGDIKDWYMYVENYDYPVMYIIIE